ncbi:MAG: serine/threonine protein kinase [Planctomycetes bacterium]|nr:serine/threonine protein kinase [Planctomycetota bacterium]
MIGSQLGPYRLDRELGSGGMGRVYAASVSKTAAGLPCGTRVALKIVHPHLLESGGYFKRFLQEAQIGRAVRHPNVVRTLDVDAFVQGGVQFHVLVMEFVEGQTLRALLDEMERVPEGLCRHVGRETAAGLAAIHAAGAVHRDLKPENVLITPDHQIKIMDLGVARLRDETVRLKGGPAGRPPRARRPPLRAGRRSPPLPRRRLRRRHAPHRPRGAAPPGGPQHPGEPLPRGGRPPPPREGPGTPLLLRRRGGSRS